MSIGVLHVALKLRLRRCIHADWSARYIRTVHPDLQQQSGHYQFRNRLKSQTKAVFALIGLGLKIIGLLAHEAKSV